MNGKITPSSPISDHLVLLGLDFTAKLKVRRYIDLLVDVYQTRPWLHRPPAIR